MHKHHLAPSADFDFVAVYSLTTQYQLGAVLRLAQTLTFLFILFLAIHNLTNSTSNLLIKPIE